MPFSFAVSFCRAGLEIPLRFALSPF